MSLFTKQEKLDDAGELPSFTQPKAPRRLVGFAHSLLLLVGLVCLTLLHVSYGDASRFLRWLGSYSASSQLRLSGSRNPAYLIEAHYGAVASENHRCSIVGVNTLKQGGNAVDAAISSVFCLGVVDMFASGIGGGGIMTVRIPPMTPDSNSSVYTIDFREVAPAQAFEAMYKGNPVAAIWSGRAVGVPSEVRGLEEAHRRWGKLPWDSLVRPSVELAKGWEVDKELGRRLPWLGDFMLTDPDWAPIFAPGGVLLREGDVIRRLNYAKTLDRIASEGSKAFYEGPTADSMVRKVQATGGILTHADLANYTVKVTRALEGTYRGRKVYTTHAPTSGPALLHMFNLMERYDAYSGVITSLDAHRMVEIVKFGFAARTNISDPAFSNDTSRIDHIPTQALADAVFPKITDNQTHPAQYYEPVFDIKEDHGTSHTSVIDKDGMAVSLTSTINFVFGSLVLDSETGVIFNDEMADFSIPDTKGVFSTYPSPYNYPQPGKRPVSSMTPTIMEYPNGSFYLCVGGAGGARIFPSVFQVVLNLDRGMDVSEAVEYGRLHDQLYPEHVDAEDWYPHRVLEGLRKRGHNVTLDLPPVTGDVQIVVKKGGTIYAASDSRKNGIAAGY